MTYQYSFAYFPPVPVLNIELSFPDHARWQGPFTAIIDSGADFTIIPLAIVITFDPPVVGKANLVSQWQDRREVQVYQLDIQIGSVILPSIEVAGDTVSNEFILGRNVLNGFDLRLNGPALQTELIGAVVE
jgi:hypothetical protein